MAEVNSDVSSVVESYVPYVVVENKGQKYVKHTNETTLKPVIRRPKKATTVPVHVPVGDHHYFAVNKTLLHYSFATH
jgi:hypothetical protein